MTDELNNVGGTADPGGGAVYFGVCGRSLAGIAGSNPAGIMDVCLF